MLLPVGVEGGKSSHIPKGTLLLLFLNTAVYVVCAVQGGLQNGFSSATILALPEDTLSAWAFWPSHPTIVSFLTSPWIHLDIVHLAGNLLFLWIFGAAAEEALGALPALGVYLAGGLGSALCQLEAAQAGLTPYDASYAGSSGAVIALILVFAIRRYRARVRLWLIGLEVATPIWLALALFVAWYGVAPALLGKEEGASGYWGHIGGVLTGLALALVMRLGSRSTTDYSIEDAIAQVEHGELKEGLHALHAIARSFPNDPRARLALARTYLKVWDQAAAASQYSHAFQQAIAAHDFNEAWAVWKEATSAGVSLPPNQVFSLAHLCTGAGRDSHAAELYRAIAQMGDTAAAVKAREYLKKLGS